MGDLEQGNGGFEVREYGRRRRERIAPETTERGGPSLQAR